MDYNKNWYNSINRSKLTPPSYVFGIVWPILYTLMGVSSFRVFNNDKCKPFCMALVFFLIQLFFNLSWSRIFFKDKKIETALYTVIYMIIFTILTVYNFYKIDKISSYLLMPYLVWISFAAYLNWYIYKNN